MNEKDLETMTTKTSIIAFADALGISKGTRITKVLDIENACKQFNLRLAEC